MKIQQTRQSSKHSSQTGFTITELMVATLVFSVILLVITTGVTQFTRNYYKGINSSTTQTVTANIVNNIAQSIQLGSSVAQLPTNGGSGNVYWLCAGNQEFVYSPGLEVSNDPTNPNYGLIVFNTSTCYDNNPTTGFKSADGWAQRRQLLQDNMRISDLNVRPVPGGPKDTFDVAATVAYGDADLLCNSEAPPGRSCNGVARYGINDIVKGADVTCRTDNGSQFCSFSRLKTTVQVRVQ